MLPLCRVGRFKRGASWWVRNWGPGQGECGSAKVELQVSVLPQAIWEAAGHLRAELGRRGLKEETGETAS